MTEEEFFNEKPKVNILQQAINRYLPYWPVYVALTLISLAVAFIYLRSQTKIYVARASILLKDPNKTADTKVLEALNIFSEKKIVDNEILVLRSSSIIEKVVSNLDLYATVYNEGNVQTEELYKDNAPVRFVAVDKSNINGGGKFPFDINWNKGFVKIANQNIPFGGIVKINNSDYFIKLNDGYNRSAEGKNFFAVFNTVGGAAGPIIGSLRANPISYQSTVLNVQLETPAPAKGVDVLNELFVVYNRAGIDDKNEIASKTLEFIDERLNKIISQLDSAEDRVQSYRSKNRITDITAQGTEYSSNLAGLQSRQAQLDIQLQVLRDVQAYVNTKGTNKSLVPALSVIDDGMLPGLVAELNTAQFDLDRIVAQAGEQSEQVKLARSKVKTLSGSVNENLRNIRTNYITEKSNIENKIQLNSSLLSRVPEQERRLLELGRQQTIKNNIYTFLLQKKEETALSAAATSGDMRVLEAASFYGPIRPIPKNFYIAALALALGVFIFYVLLLEQFNNKVLFRSQIENKTTVPVLAEIVQNKSKETIAIQEGTRTVIAEQFRVLRTNLAFAGLNEQDKVCLVTSSISGEGKSFVATNLAISMTLVNKKVALLELDLRKPKLSKYLNVKRDPGISNYLVNLATIDDIIKPTEFKNLSLVPAGVIPPNPSELLTCPNFAKLISELKERFDVVIIDSAPVGPVTDAILISPLVDVSLYVVRHGHTALNLLNLADNLRKENKLKRMNIVFNGIKPRGFHLFNYSFGGYGNGYGYGYGYGYTYGYGYGGDGGGYYDNTKSQPGFKNLFGFTTKIKKAFKR